MNKSEQIKQAIAETKLKRQSQKPVVYQLKLQNLSKQKRKLLKEVFIQSKWLCNYLVADLNRLNEPANKIEVVEVKVKDKFEQRQLSLLGSQIKQEISDRIKDNLRLLAKLKANGYEVGALKFKRYVNSIPLKQYGVTYELDLKRNRVRIQKL
ncbi:hypothetical protein [Pseudothermotoga thermarum]|uniref:hypothetical protein n=1 Tax=Pseudothermotoga thermarum TaxID=119394 RepID=UPI001B7FBCFC|nr:hypothetical protein [Pseudothermotoga thermarum]